MQMQPGRSDGQDSTTSPVAATCGTTTAEGTKAVHGVSREFHNFVADIEDLIKRTTTLTGEDLERARQKLSQRVAQARESIEKVGGTISDRARRTATVTDTYVHQQPWQAVGIGAAFGVLVGFALARRRS